MAATRRCESCGTFTAIRLPSLAMGIGAGARHRCFSDPAVVGQCGLHSLGSESLLQEPLNRIFSSRNFHFAFRLRINTPPVASVRGPSCIHSKAKYPVVPGWAISQTKKPATFNLDPPPFRIHRPLVILTRNERSAAGLGDFPGSRIMAASSHRIATVSGEAQPPPNVHERSRRYRDTPTPAFQRAGISPYPCLLP